MDTKVYKKPSAASRSKASLRHALLAVFLMIAMLLPQPWLTSSVASADSAPTKVINLVYDDSGSMIYLRNKNGSGGKYVDTWCKAKYALEVFAGMLGENDTLNVFYMSEHADGGGAPNPKLKGSDGATVNISKVHDKRTADGETPYEAVEAAVKYFSDKSAAKADEKWLVVLTDGEFEGMTMKDVDKKFKGNGNLDDVKIPDDVKIMFLGMGSRVDMKNVQSDEARGIYYEKAATSDEILRKLTEIGQKVFNRPSLKVNNNRIKFDIPMKELIVFAQGENVSIKGVTPSGGQQIAPSENPVTVQYSEAKASTTSNHYDYDKVKKTVDKSLKGSIATFRGNFAEGDYTVDVTGAKTVEVYYQPDVDIVATLRKGDKEVTDLKDLEAGEYTVDFDLVKGGTTEKISNSELLGDVKYEATLNNNDNVQDNLGKGSTVTIEEGPLSIDATARYLKHYTVQTHLDYSIYKDKEVAFTVDDETVHELSKEGFPKNDQPTVMRATIDGKEPTAEQWEAMGVPEVKASSKGPDLQVNVEKSEEPGVYNLYPVAPEKLKGKTYKDINVSVNYEGSSGKETWAGEGNGTVKVADTRCWACRNFDWIIIAIIAACILALILGYIPGIKHYLPKKLKKRPLVKSKVIGSYTRPPKPTNGDFTKKTITTLLPYVAEKGTARYVPKGIPGAPKLQLKGAKGGKMEITNLKEFGKKKNIQFDGERADRLVEDYAGKKFTASSGLTMTAEINGVKYTCSLNE